MPADFTMVPHYLQSNPGACLPACVRMVLARHGELLSEAKCAEFLGSYEFGTPASRVLLLNKHGYQVRYESLWLEDLIAALENDLFPIAFVQADFLPWSDFTGFHAVVVVNIAAEQIYLHDPARNEGNTPIHTDGFLMAWEEFDTKAAIIMSKR